MKNIAAAALFLAASLFATGNASAQDHTVKATIPFAFTVGSRTMPAGTYTVASSMATPNLVSLNDRHGANVFAMGLANQENRDQSNKLVFHKYGNQYFLSQIRTAGSSINVDLITGKAEQRARSRTDDASLRVNTAVMIALK